MECKYCKNTFTNKTSLNTHQKTAKYCLKARGDVIETKYTCHGCTKQFSRKYEYQRHLNICKADPVVEEYKLQMHSITNANNQFKNQLDAKDIRIEELEQTVQEQKKTIKDLQDKLENIAIKAVSRPTTTKNTQINYIQQLIPVTQAHLLESVNNLTIDHIIKGPEGYAEYALEYPLKDRLVCSDYSRRKVKFKDKDGKVITDPEMNVLASKFFESIKEKNKELIKKYASEAQERLGDDNVMDTVVKLFDYKSAVEKGSEGEKTDFHHDFVRQMCSQTIKE